MKLFRKNQRSPRSGEKSFTESSCFFARGSNQPIDCKRAVTFQRNLETTTSSPLPKGANSEVAGNRNIRRIISSGIPTARQNLAGNRSCKESGSVLSNELPGEREQTRTKGNRKKRNEKNSQTRFIPALLFPPAKLGSYSRFLLAWPKFAGEF